MAEGNRKDPRARVLNMTVRYKSATVDEFIENHSHDISKGGIFIKTRSPFPAGTLLKFEVRIAEDQKLMQGVGRVVWRREPDRAEESFPAGMGIKFIKTAEGSAELISQIVAARQGAESSFDAGVRESGVSVSGPPAASVPVILDSSSLNESARPTSLGLGPTDSERTPALQVESGPRSWPIEAETTVSSPPKKRPDQAPEKRKVVLQGPALEGPPSQPKPVPASPTLPAEERAPSRAHSRQALAEETTARRIRPAASGAPRATSPSLYGLVAILGAIALGVVLLNRSRSEEPEEESLPPATAAAPLPAPPAPVPPAPAPAVVAAEPAPLEPTPEATPPETAPNEAAPVEPASAPAAAAPSAPAEAPKPAAAAPAPVPSPPAAAAPAPRPPAPPRPKPAPAPRSEGVAIIKPSEEPAPPAAAPAPPAAAEPAPSAPAPEKPAEKKKPPAAAAPPQQPAPAPSAPSPAPAAPAAPPASDDNPY